MLLMWAWAENSFGGGKERVSLRTLVIVEETEEDIASTPSAWEVETTVGWCHG
jgi:hypothetical protein